MQRRVTLGLRYEPVLGLGVGGGNGGVGGGRGGGVGVKLSRERKRMIARYEIFFFRSSEAVKINLGQK